MTAKATAVSVALDAVLETARDLHAAGFIDMRSMPRYDAIRLQPVPNCPGAGIRALRARHKLSQAVFASVPNISLSTVRQWGASLQRPFLHSRGSCRQARRTAPGPWPLVRPREAGRRALRND